MEEYDPFTSQADYKAHCDNYEIQKKQDFSNREDYKWLPFVRNRNKQSKTQQIRVYKFPKSVIINKKPNGMFQLSPSINSIYQQQKRKKVKLLVHF